MARFQPKHFKFFLERMAQRVVARTQLTDLSDGGVLHTILSAIARELDDISFQMSNLQRIWDIDTARGEDLDDRARDTSPDKISRRLASKAYSTVIFSRSGTTGTVPIPAGSVVKVPGGGPEYATTAGGSIIHGNSSSAAIAILAVEAGSDGNVDINTITQLDAITGVETVTNNTIATGGQDRETDGQLRDRIKAYQRSLSRGTPDALKFAVLSVSLEDFGNIVTAEVVELDEPDLGQVIIYVDNGLGTIEVTDDNYGSPEDVVTFATGGEVRLQLNHKPVRQGLTVTVEKNASPLTEGVDFTLNYATGLITLASPLVVSNSVTCEYTWYEGLIAEAQKVVDGDPSDRANYPGYRAAGTQVFVIAPRVLQIVVQASIVIATGANRDRVREAVANAIARYINNLPINGDVIFTELVHAVQGVPGVVDVIFYAPTENLVTGDGEIARIQSANIDLT